METKGKSIAELMQEAREAHELYVQKMTELKRVEGLFTKAIDEENKTIQNLADDIGKYNKALREKIMLDKMDRQQRVNIQSALDEMPDVKNAMHIYGMAIYNGIPEMIAKVAAEERERKFDRLLNAIIGAIIIGYAECIGLIIYAAITHV